MQRLFISFLFIAATLSSCTSKSGSAEKEETEASAKYHLSVRNQNQDWTNDGSNDDDNFQLTQMNTDKQGVFSLTVRIGQQSARTAQFTVYTDLDIRKGNVKKTYQLKHPAVIIDQMDCFNQPGSCIGNGSGHISGTVPTAPAGTEGMDDDLHAESGTLTLTDVIITEEDEMMVRGRVSGTFTFSGINTGYPVKPNPGKASGRFENAAFEVLK